MADADMIGTIVAVEIVAVEAYSLGAPVRQPVPASVSRRVSDATHLTCEFSDNALLQQLVGPHNANLTRLEQRLGVILHNRGNTITIEGPPAQAARAKPRCANFTNGSRPEGDDRNGRCRRRRAACADDDGGAPRARI